MHSAKELEHYQRVRAQFEQPDEKEKAAKQQAAPVDEAPQYHLDLSNDQGSGKGKGKGKGKAVDFALDHNDGGEHDKINGLPIWEDSAKDDDEELYG